MGTLLLTKPTVTDQDALDQIEAKAKALWADRWLVEITRKYCELHDGGDTIENFRNRRSTLGRLFDKRSPAAATLFNLAQCVGLTFELK
jgi:hypothetical protein